MKQARPVGLSPDGDRLILLTEEGEHIQVPADDRLRSILARDPAQPGQLETAMPLTPREIQAKIRGGATLAEVAAAAGMPEEKIEPYAAPVLAEREHVAGLAQAAPVRRGGESGSHRQLRRALQERLLANGLDIADVEWDAWRAADRKWIIKAAYQSGTGEHEAQFLYDQRGRFCTAHNDEARRLLDDGRPQPRRRSGEDPDAEPTVDFNDEFAIVNAVGVEENQDPATDTGEPTLTRINGVYDIAPEDNPGELDRLLGMLRTYSEDSVEIYPGLDVVRPVGALPPVPQSPETFAAAAQPPTPAVEDARAQHPSSTAQAGPAPTPEPAPEPETDGGGQPDPTETVTPAIRGEQRAPHLRAVPPLTVVETRVESVTVELTGPAAEEEAPPEAPLRVPDELPTQPPAAQAKTQAVKPPRPERRTKTRPKPGQEPLLGAPAAPSGPPGVDAATEETTPIPRPDRAKSKKRRASVPTWDEIMFGSPQRPRGE